MKHQIRERRVRECRLRTTHHTRPEQSCAMCLPDTLAKATIYTDGCAPLRDRAWVGRLDVRTYVGRMQVVGYVNSLTLEEQFCNVNLANVDLIRETEDQVFT
jgi:hypothetical protein